MIDLVVSQTNNSNKSKYQQSVSKQGLFALTVLHANFLTFHLGDLVYLMKNVKDWLIHQKVGNPIYCI